MQSEDRLMEAAESLREARQQLQHLRFKDVDDELANNVYELCDHLNQWEDTLAEEAETGGDA